MPIRTSGTQAPAAAQVARQAVRPLVELAVGHPLLAGDDRHAVGRGRGLALEEVVDAGVPVVAGRMDAPRRQHLPALRFVEHRQLGDAPRGIAGGGVQQPHQVAGHAPRGRAVEEVGVVLQPAGEAIRPPRLSTEVRSKLARSLRTPELLSVRPGQLLVHGREVEQVEQHLHDRRRGSCRAPAAAPPAAFRTAGPGARRRASAVARTRLTSSANDGIARDVGAQRQIVDEEADEVLDLGAVAVRHERADGEVVLLRPAVEEKLEAGEQDHEERGPFAVRQRLQTTRKIGRESNVLVGAAEALHRRARPVAADVQVAARLPGAGASRRVSSASTAPVKRRRCQSATSAYWMGSAGSAGSPPRTSGA